MSFRSVAVNAFSEIKSRAGMMNKVLHFGVSFLDDALIGIFPGDLILLGAPSGVGKTQLCCNIALANLAAGKRIHYIALEAEDNEIERRLKYPLVMGAFFSDSDRNKNLKRPDFDRWMLGENLEAFEKYENIAAEFFEKAYANLFVLYKTGDFGVADLIEKVLTVADKSDLIIVDHVHYFDFEDDNESRAMKQIAKTARDLCLENQKPMILVAHLRKKDRNNDDLVAGLEEFHGSSDLYKIATKVITVSGGRPTGDGLYETFFRIPKNRLNGGVTRYSGRTFYSPKKGTYEQDYKIGWAEQSRKTGFEPLDADHCPSWAVGSGRGSGDVLGPPIRKQTPHDIARRPPTLQELQEIGSGKRVGRGSLPYSD